MNSYLLLRNNKEDGPYSLDQLVKLGLKKYDLVWAEGKSAAWRYPGEVEELKPYAPPIDELPFSEPVKKQTVQAANSICNADAYTQQKVTVAAKQKPRIRVKAEWSKIETPVAVAAAEKAAYQQAATENKNPVLPPVVQDKPTWETSWLNWQEEQTTAKEVAQNKPAAAKRAAPVTINIAAANNVAGTTATVNETEKKTYGDGAPVLETKFSQSLSDIKELYTATVLKAKTRAGEPKRFKSLAIILMLAIPVMCFGVWLGSKWTKKSDAAGQVVYAKNTPGAQPGATQPNKDEAAAQDNATNTQAAVKTSSKEMIPDFDDNKTTPQPAAVTKHKTVRLPAATPLRKQPVIAKKQNNIIEKAKNLITPPTAAVAGQRVKTVNKALAGIQNALHLPQHPGLPVPAPETPAENTKPAFPHSVRNESIDDYVSVEADKPYTQTVQDVKLNVQNVADVPLDLVVIDVEYFDAANRFKNGQTIRIKNIPAGETINVNVPDNPNASKLRYKVSLVSADRKNVYIVGE